MMTELIFGVNCPFKGAKRLTHLEAFFYIIIFFLFFFLPLFG